MKRLIKASIMVITSLLLLMGCNTEKIDNTKEEILSVKISSNKSSFYPYEEGFKFTPILEGNTDKELQYHWVLVDNQKFEGFYIPEQGPQEEIINLGEAVELGVFAEVSYINAEVYKEFKVKLQVENKENGEILATDEIIIENHAGYYKIQGIAETSIENPRTIDVNSDEIISKVYDQLTQVEKDNLVDTWKNATVSKMTLRKEMGIIIDESYIGKEVYVVDFPGKGNYTPNNKIVFASLEDYKILGYGYID